MHNYKVDVFHVPEPLASSEDEDEPTRDEVMFSVQVYHIMALALQVFGNQEQVQDFKDKLMHPRKS